MRTPHCPRCGLEIEKTDCSACGAIVSEVFNKEHRVNTGSHPSLASLKDQLETILNFVYEAEANWRFDDRLDMATRRAAR